LETDIENLKNNIVKSPEKLRNYLKLLSERKREHLDLMISLASQIEEKKKITSVLTSAEKKQEARYQILKEILEFVESCK